MKNLSFTTKARTLEALSTKLTTAQVKPLLIYDTNAWHSDKECILDAIAETFQPKTVIIRSSVQGEDSEESSQAGAYLSIPHVNPEDPEAVTSAIHKVISSYGGGPNIHEFFIQEQVCDISMSGVVFTSDLDTLAPYYIVNYDDTNSSHDSVTSGHGRDLKTWICFKRSPYPSTDYRLRQLLDSAREIEQLFGCEHLDIEFAFDKSDLLYILQVRPIVTLGKTVASDVETLLRRISAKYESLSSPHYSICGKKGIYSVMSDWNPAEMIGIRPRPLALSLYKELITDSVWAYQRDNYGYRNLRSFPLLVSFMGYPYIDVRASFNSFIPRQLDDELAQKLVDYYVTMLERSPTDHDKVEFNIVFSCYYLSLPRKIRKLMNFGFTELELDRIKFGLLNLTNGIVSPSHGLYRKDLKRIEELNTRFERIRRSTLSPVEKIYWLIEDGKRYGTLPFAGLARGAFIAVQFLQSFVELGILEETERLRFLNSLNTVARQMGEHCHALREKQLTKEEFLHLYGHLRPGTYDILSPRYDEAFEAYFKEDQSSIEETAAPPFEFTDSHKEQIRRQLVQNGILVTPDELLLFIREAIEGREYAKFVFTRNLSEVLKLIASLGESYGISRDELSYLNISTLLNLYSSLEPYGVEESFRLDIEKNRTAFQRSSGLRLPQLIASEQDVYQFQLGLVEPNFITHERVTDVTVIEEALFKADLTSKIVLIKSADPGYDWLFSRNIGGLVTMYGGANSHMAIRCAELRIPAVIGCGEENFKRWASATVLDVDCANRKVRVVQ